MIARLLVAAGVVCFALPALADGEVQKLITPADKVRLDKYDETRKAALDEARAGDAADVKQLDALLAKPLVSFSDKDLTGNWQCRTIKAGGLSPLVIYGWFKCKVSDDGSGWMLEKITGSQRTKGRFFDDGEKRSIYLGLPFCQRRSCKTLWRRPAKRSGRLYLSQQRQRMAHRVPGALLRIEARHP